MTVLIAVLIQIDSSRVKCDYVRSGGFASLVYKEQEKIPRPLSTNCDLDEAEYYWIEMLDSDDVFAIPSITEKSSHKITIDEMRVLFPPAPKLQKYYTVEEASAILRPRPSRPGPRAPHKRGPPTFQCISRVE